jgi:hypothetical protein
VVNFLKRVADLAFQQANTRKGGWLSGVPELLYPANFLSQPLKAASFNEK